MSSGSYARLYASPGPDENHRAALSYVPLVALAFLFDKRGSFYLRFHAAQGLALTLVALALGAAHWLIFGTLDSVPSLAMVFVELALTWLFAVVCVLSPASGSGGASPPSLAETPRSRWLGGWGSASSLAQWLAPRDDALRERR